MRAGKQVWQTVNAGGIHNHNCSDGCSQKCWVTVTQR